MGNEASMEGGDGALAAGELTGPEEELSRLSEEERRKLVSTMAEAQARSSEHQPSGGRGSGGLSKSRTVDAFGEGPPSKPKPGRSPSSLSLLESRFRQEPKDPEQPRTGMFSSSFLSGVSSAVSSASIPKFSLFGDDEDVAAKQGQKPPGPQQGSSKGQGPPGQKQGAVPQGPGGKPAGPQQQGPAKAAAQPSGTGKPGGQLCPLCNTTELNVQAKDQPPNYSTCTQCKQQVCSLCGFSPPDSEGKEWLCLNCQMQRAMGGMEPPGPPMMKPKQSSAPPSPQKKEPPAGVHSKDEPGKKPSMLTKQQSISDTKGATPPPTPKEKTPGPGAQQEAQPGLKGGQKPPPLQKADQSPVASPQPSPVKKQEGGGFFGGFGLGGLTDTKKGPAESVTGKLFSGFGSSSKPQGGTAPKSPVATSQATEGVSGKRFGFGSSILSSATNLITGEEPKSPPASSPDSPIDSGAKSTPGSSKEPASPKPGSTDGKSLADKPISEAAKTVAPQSITNCPLCKIELNMGSGDVPNYSTCTECQKYVCNLCGFNPMPHLSEKEWLCLNCQTQRALSGQLGDMPPPPSPSKMPAKSKPTPPSSPARAASTTPSPSAPTVTASPTKALTRTPSVTQAPADKSEHDSATADAKHVLESAAVKQDEGLAVVESTKVVPEPNKEQTLDTAYENTTVKFTPPEQTISVAVPPADIILRDIADARETDAKQCGIVEQTEPKAQNEKGGESEPEQHEPVENVSPSNHINIAEPKESINKYSSEDTVIDNQAEIRLDRLQVTKSKSKDINEAKNIIASDGNSEKAHRTSNHGTNVVSLAESSTKELASLANMQTNTEASSDSSYRVTEKETVVNIGHDSTNNLKRFFTPEKPLHPVQIVIRKDEVKNEIVPDHRFDAKHTFAHTSKHPNITKWEFVEDEYEVEIKTGNSSPSGNPCVYSVRAEAENHRIEDRYFDQAEEKQSGRKSKVEQELIAQGTAHKSSEETQAPPAETPECASFAFPFPNELIKSELKTKHDILNTIPHTPCLTTSDVPSCTYSVIANTDKNTHTFEMFPAGNIIQIIDSTTIEKEQNEEVEDTKSESSDRIYDHTSKPNVFKLEKIALDTCTNIEAISHKDEECLSSQMREVMLSVDTQSVFEPSLEPALRRESVDSKQHSEKAKKTGKLDHNCIIPEMSSSSLTEAENVLNVTKEKTVKTNNDSVEIENRCVVKRHDSLSAIRDQEFPRSRNNSVPENKTINQTSDTASRNIPEPSTIQVVLSDQRTQEPPLPAVDLHDNIQLKTQIKSNLQQDVPLIQFLDSFYQNPKMVRGEQRVKPDSQHIKEFINTQSNSYNRIYALDPVENPILPIPVASKQNIEILSGEVQSPGTQGKNQDGTNPLINPIVIKKLGQKKEDAARSVEDKELLKEPTKKDSVSQEYSPTSPSDLAKLETSVLPILEGQTTPSIEQSQSELDSTKCQLEVSPVESPELTSEEDRQSSDAIESKKEKKKLLVPTELKQNILEDSSEGESSPLSERESKPGEEKDIGRNDAVWTEKEITALSTPEDVSPSVEEKRKARGLVKHRSINPEEEIDHTSINSVAKIEELSKREQTCKENGAGIRHFKTIELNTVATVRQTSDDGEPESLTDSPDDRSRGEGSSSLHASSFTPGTSPTSLSSLDEDSDSSSPSHIKSSSEGKQHRKAKHRQPGQMLPTIEDSSEEEELREEEELLKEQEKHSSKKSKKDKEEIRAQRRRERPKTPPSNLSPIEDASPTEEQRQEAEMEEIRRSSCSDFSPSMESEPEGFEILPEKIAAVQKVYHLPTSVSLYSPTDEQYANKQSKETTEKQPSHTSYEAYEEIMLRKSPTTEDLPPGKESLYGGMLIEDYAYESLVEDAHVGKEPDKISVPEKAKKLRSPDEVYEDMMQIKKEMLLKEQQLQKENTVREFHTTDTTKDGVFSSARDTPDTRQDTVSTSISGQFGKDGKPLLNAEEAYMELMKKQRAVLTPGTSPTQPISDLCDRAHDIQVTTTEKTETFPQRRILPIPDLTVTQCSSGEEESGEESTVDQNRDDKTVSGFTSTSTHAVVTEPTTFAVNLSQEKTTGSSASKQASGPVADPISSRSESPSQKVSSQAPMTEPTDQPSVVNLSKSSALTQVDASPIPTPSIVPRPVPVTSPLPTVPQYTPIAPSVISTAPPVPPKPAVLRRGVSQEKTDIPAPPPLPPPTLPKPAVYPKKIPPQVPQRTALSGIPSTCPIAQVRQSMAPNFKPHVPPPVPPKPSTIPAGLTFSHRQMEAVKPPIAPKPMSSAQPLFTIYSPVRPNILPTSTEEGALNLSPASEIRTGPASPIKSPTSPRFGKSLYDTYVVITLPSQPGSPIEGVTTQAQTSSGPLSPSKQSHLQFDFQAHPQTQLPPQTQTNRIPLALTSDPGNVISNMSHVNEAVSASQPSSVIPNVGVQVVTNEVQRTTVSVVHGQTPPPTPRATGIIAVHGDINFQQLEVQNGHAYHSGVIVDLRAPKADVDIRMKGVDLSSSETQRQCFIADGRQQSAVHSSIMNLSTDTSSVSVVTDSMTILTCTDTIAYANNNLSQVTSMPLQLTTSKSFEPVSQIIYRPVDSQPEKPINLSTTLGKTHSVPAPTASTMVNNGVSTSIPPQLENVSGAIDLTAGKPVQTMVSVDGSSLEVVTTVISEDDSKPVDLTAGRKAVCCDVVYKLPFAGSCATQQSSAPLPEDRFGYRDDHYQYDRSPYGMRGLGGIKPSMSDTNLAEAGLFLYKSKNRFDYNGEVDGAVDLSSGKMSGEAVDYSSKATGAFTGVTIPQYSQARITAVGSHFGSTSVLRSSNGVVYSSVAAPNPSTYAITTQPGSIFSTTYNSLSGMHTSDTMPSLSNLQNQPLTRSHSFLSTVAVTTAEEQDNMPLNLEINSSKNIFSAGRTEIAPTITTAASLDYTDASLEAIAASLEALSSPMLPGDEKYQMEREFLELEKIKQQRLAEELEWERQEIQRFREQEQLLVQKELEELQVMKQQILCQQEEERQAHLMMQKETYAQQQEQLEQIQRLQEQLRMQLEEQKYRQMYPEEIHEQSLGHIVGTDKKMDSGCQTDEEDNTEKAYSAGRKKKTTKKSVDSCVQTDDEDQDEWEVSTRGRRSKPRGGKYNIGDSCGVSVQALTEISVQTDSSGTLRGHTVQTDTRVDFPNSDRPSSPKRRPTPLEISQSPLLKTDSSSLQVSPIPPKSPKVLYSPISPCMSPSKSLEFVSYEKSSGDTSPQKICSADPSKVVPSSPRAKVLQRSLSDPKPMSPTSEERAANFQFSEGYTQGKGSPSSTPTGTQKKVKRTLPNPPSEEETANGGQAAYSTASARRRLCRSSNMARAKILQDIDRELDLVERESSKLRKKQAELDEEEKEIDAKLRYLEMGINRRKDALLKEREKRERAYLQSVAEDRDYMSDSEVSNIRETRRSDGREDASGLVLERPHTAPQSELEEFVPPQTKYEYGKYSQYHYPQYQQSLYQTQQPYQSQSIYSSVPSLTASQQQSYHQMLLLQQKAREQATLLSELDATKVSTNYENSSYLAGKYGSHLDLHGLDDRGGSIAGSPMSNVSADSFYDLDQHHQTPRSYLLLEDATELTKSPSGLSSTSYGIAERELAKAERLLRCTAADVGTDYLGSSSRLHSYGKTQDDEDSMEEPYELKLLKQQLKQEFRRSTGGTESLEQLASLSHHYTPSTSVTSAGYRAFPKTEKYSISRLTLEKQAAKQLPTSMLYQKHKSTSNIGKYSIQDSRSLDTDYSSYLGSSGASPRSSRLLQDEITFGLRKNIADQQKYLGSNLGVSLAGSLNLGQSLNLSSGVRASLGEDSVYPSGTRSRPSSRPSSMYGLDLSIKRDISSSSLRLKSEGDPSSETSAYQTPSGRTKPTSLPIGQSGRGRIPIVAQNSEEESPLSPVGQPMGMARASAGPLPPISADSRDQFGSCLSLQDPQQQHLREDPTRGCNYMLIDDLQGTMSDSEALSESMVGLNRDDPGNTLENVTDAYHLRREETDWFDKPREDGPGLDRRQIKSQQYPFSYARIKLQRDPKDRSVSGLCNGPAGNGLGIRIIGGKEVPGSDGEIGAYVAKVLPGGAAEQSGKIVEGMQVLEWNGISLSSKTYEEVQALVSQQCSEAELCVRLDLNMLSDSEGSHLDLHEPTKAERPPRSPGVDPKQLAAELQKVSQQQAPSSTASSLTALDKSSASGASSSVPSPGQPASPSVSKKRHSKTLEAAKTQSHPITGEIQLQINYDKQLGNLIVHVLQARNLAPRDNNGYSDPFVKVYLLPGRGAENKRRSKHAQKSLNPEWNQTVIYKNIHLEQLRKKTLEVSVWDYDKSSSNDFLGEVLIDLSNTSQLDNVPRWLPLKEQCEGEHHRRSHTGQGRSPKVASGHSTKTSGHSSQDSPKSSVIKSRSHGIFPDPAKDTQVPTIEKSHSSPSTSKPSPSEGQARSHGTSRAHSKSGASRAHPEDTMATAEAASEQHRLQPMSRSHRSADAPVTAASLDSGLSGSAFSLLEEEGEENGVDSAIFQVPRFSGKIPNGTDVVKSIHGETDGKTQVMGEIKIALKKEMKTEGEHLVLEILQCRNITYKFKTPDHLPDMYVKLYVVNVATQKRIIKKKTRVCRHDREPSFNETFRFCMNPTGHSIQLFLVSNGGKFVKKTLIGEAYVWLDKVDLRKRVVSWHKLLATTAQIQS